MKVTFLEARVPLTKHYTATSKEPYPNAFEFKSHTHHVKNLTHMMDLMKTHASQGHCLLKGEIQKELEWESRAGSTLPHSPTMTIVFDIDGLTSVPDIDAFMAKIGLPNISYIVQWSASYGVYGNFELRCHVIVFLTAASSPSALKTWLKQLNLQHFQTDLRLTKTHCSLHWGLDITTCQNDKLIFITPPVCTPPSIDQFTGQRISLVAKATDFFDFNTVTLLPAETLKGLEEAEINRLRKAAGLSERKPSQFKTKELKGETYMPNPDTATVTGHKEERGFTYLNLNNGDSWGYYHPTDNPTFIYNFKGEPTYKTSELLPDYWNSLQIAKKQTARSAHQGKLFLAFRDFRSADYYNGWYDQNNDELVLNTAKSERQLSDFLANYGQPVPDAVPIWSVMYDPNKPVIDLAACTVNTFQPSMYMKFAVQRSTLVTPKPTPIIDKLIKHVFGDDMYDHFLNWLAFSFQYRTAPKTAWVAQGTQGTGKGLLVNEVLVKLFGPSNVAQKRMEELEDRFNPHLETSLLVIIDEAQISDSGRSKMIMANLKNQITEPVVTIRRMRQTSYETPNRVGFIFNSNKPDPVVIEAGDRRFNVGEYQSAKLQITDAEVRAIDSELLDFAYRLQRHSVDFDAVRTPKINEAKREMQMASRTSADAVADAILNGDMSTLWDALPTVEMSMLDPMAAARLIPYETLIKELVTTRRTKLSRDELSIIFNYNVGNVPSSPCKFTMYLKHHGLQIDPIRLNGKLVRGVTVNWQNSDEWFEERLSELQAAGKPNLKVVKQVSNSDLTEV